MPEKITPNAERKLYSALFLYAIFRLDIVKTTTKRGT